MMLLVVVVIFDILFWSVFVLLVSRLYWCVCLSGCLSHQCVCLSVKLNDALYHFHQINLRRKLTLTVCLCVCMEWCYFRISFFVVVKVFVLNLIFTFSSSILMWFNKLINFSFLSTILTLPSNFYLFSNQKPGKNQQQQQQTNQPHITQTYL